MSSKSYYKSLINYLTKYLKCLDNPLTNLLSNILRVIWDDRDKIGDPKFNNIPVQWFDENWHYFFQNQHFIPKETKIVHAVCKDFDVVWRKYA